jgi:hypothetical protein
MTITNSAIIKLANTIEKSKEEVISALLAKDAFMWMLLRETENKIDA